MKTIFLVFSAFSASVYYATAQPEWSAYGGIPSAATQASVIDEYENKWVAMFGGGISKFKPDETYDNYNSSNSGMPEDFITYVTIDNLGNKWIGTNGSGVVMYDGSTWTTYGTSVGLAGNQVNCITVDGDNIKWIGLNQDGLCYFDGSTFTDYNTGNSPLPNDNVNCITIDASGNKWIGTYEGLVKFDGTNWTVYTTSNSDLPHDQVYSVVFESPTIIWIGTGGGVCKFNGASTWAIYDTGNSGLPYNYVNCIAIDQNNTKWIGTTQGGMAEFDGISSWTVYNTSNSNIPGMDIRDIDVDAYNNLWICSNGGFAFYGEVPEPSSDATLSALLINGISEPSFDPEVYYYSIELPYGTVDPPVITATTTDPMATMVITDATSVPGFGYVEVTAEDGIAYNMYWIDFTVASTPNTDATLHDLTVNGETVNGFDPDTLTYIVELPFGTTIVPAVDATTNDPYATKIITDAPSLPGSTTVDVTAQDTTTTLTYTVNFTLSPPATDATLSDLKVNDTTVQGFDPGTYNYNMEFPYGTTELPVVTATANDADASVVIADAVALPGTATVTVTAEDGTTELIYNISFTVATEINTIPEGRICIFPNPSDGVFYILTDYSSVMTIRDVTGRIVVSDNIQIPDRRIDLSGYGNGMYFIQIYIDVKEVSIYKKICIQ